MTHTTYLIKATGKKTENINYRRRMYAVLRRFTKEVFEGDRNECYLDIHALPLYCKAPHDIILKRIVIEIEKEVGVIISLKKIDRKEYLLKKKTIKNQHSILTYQELNSLFIGKSFVPVENRKHIKVIRRVKLSVPFIGKVS